jgi:hypothetical protein
MQKYIWTTLILFLFYACSVPATTVQKQVVTTDANKSTESMKKREVLGAKIVPSKDIMNQAVPVVAEVQQQVTVAPIVSTEEDFVPEHIKNSHIEVVEHY